MEMRSRISLFLFFVATFIHAAPPKAVSSSVELEKFLSVSRRSSGIFTKTSAKVEDDDDNFQAFASECLWDTAKKSFEFTLYDNETGKVSGKFSFSLNEGFQYVDAKTQVVTKSGILTLFYQRLWASDGNFSLNKSFHVKKDLVLQGGELIQNDFVLTPKSPIAALKLKPVEATFDSKVSVLQFLRFEVDGTVYTWALDE